jgi:hypothetical protein
MKEYIVISETEVKEMELAISKLLNEGWRLAGGISIAYKHEPAEHMHGHILYAQALEK